MTAWSEERICNLRQWWADGLSAAANKRGLKGISYEFVLKLITTEHAA